MATQDTGRPKRRVSPMLVPTIVMAVLAAVLIGLAYSRGKGEHVTGMRAGLTMGLQILPLLVFAFLVAGLIQVLVPKDLVMRWVGDQAGFRGILIGTVAGGLTPGGPYVSLPLVVGLVRSGASVGTVVAFLTGWSLWAVARMPMEVGILGWKLTLTRFLCTFFFPPIAGLLAQSLFGQFR